MKNDQISPEVRAQVLRETAEHFRRERLMMDLSIRAEHESGIAFTVRGELVADECAAAIDDLAVREEGRAAYLAEQRKAVQP